MSQSIFFVEFEMIKELLTHRDAMFPEAYRLEGILSIDSRPYPVHLRLPMTEAISAFTTYYCPPPQTHTTEDCDTRELTIRHNALP